MVPLEIQVTSFLLSASHQNHTPQSLPFSKHLLFHVFLLSCHSAFFAPSSFQLPFLSSKFCPQKYSLDINFQSLSFTTTCFHISCLGFCDLTSVWPIGNYLLEILSFFEFLWILGGNICYNLIPQSCLCNH